MCLVSSAAANQSAPFAEPGPPELVASFADQLQPTSTHHEINQTYPLAEAQWHVDYHHWNANITTTKH